jgi:lipid kinase YegS
VSKRQLRLILNGKKAGLPTLRQAVAELRAAGHGVDVRVTWEAGDAQRFAERALKEDCDVIVAGGGDGTVNEIINGMFLSGEAPEKPLAILPLGSANDFAHGCGIPVDDALGALRLAAEQPPQQIDVARVNDQYFVNALVCGFGAEVTFQTPERMKRAIGGLAYSITGFFTALKRTVYRGQIATDNGCHESEMVFAVLANGLQAGGVTLTPHAKLNDGKLDLLSVPPFSLTQIPALVSDITHLAERDPRFLRYEQVSWLDFQSDIEIPISPDGEEMHGTRAKVTVLPRALPFIMPEGPLLLPT